MRTVAALSLVAALAMSLGSRQIIGLIYGPAYAAAAPVLAAHAWGGIFVGVGVASTAWFINTRNTQFGLYQAIAGAVVSIGLNLVLIPHFGVVGAAWTLVAAQFVSAFAFNACFASTRPIFRIQFEAFNVLRWRR
jgi:O-antigen/teichoic acid export membrane protein